ncbi:MAG: hypothetical protein HYV04_10260 [Deltaproteobacteria bacterium]|nr:hypothetical protein [Deltaproteobacteria bacterium]
MQTFPASFALFLYQIGLGGLFALAAVPFHELERGFYKSTAGVLFVAALLSFVGKLNLYGTPWPGDITLPASADIIVHLLFVLAFGLYIVSLWGERPRFRARSFAFSVLLGTAGLALSSHAFRQAPLWSFETLLYPVSFLLSALLLGGVTVGMLIGHWYLIDTVQSIDPFVRIFKFFVYSLITQAAYLMFLALALYLLGSAGTLSGLERLWEMHFFLLSARVMIAHVGPLLLSYMIWRTLQIPHTMAATGLFYVALLGVFVGEILGRQIMALTSIPF